MDEVQTLGNHSNPENIPSQVLRVDARISDNKLDSIHRCMLSRCRARSTRRNIIPVLMRDIDHPVPKWQQENVRNASFLKQTTPTLTHPERRCTKYSETYTASNLTQITQEINALLIIAVPSLYQ